MCRFYRAISGGTQDGPRGKLFRDNVSAQKKGHRCDTGAAGKRSLRLTGETFPTDRQGGDCQPAAKGGEGEVRKGSETERGERRPLMAGSTHQRNWSSAREGRGDESSQGQSELTKPAFREDRRITPQEMLSSMSRAEGDR